MRRRNHAARTALVVVVLLAAGVLLGGRAWLRASMSGSADTDLTTKVPFAVEKGESAASIATRLQARGLIRSGFAFTWAVNARGLDNAFHTGSYRVAASMTGEAILETLTSEAATVRVTIPEGFTIAQIAEKLSDAGVADAASVRECAKRCVFETGVATERPQGMDIEGYLFPDTYEFIAGSDAQEVLRKLVSALDRKLDAELLADIDAFGRSTHEVLTMASMLEKEVTDARDRRIVAGILWKRLELGIPLGVDATVIYALGEHRSNLTADELRVDSPYNTRRRKGMPPGPICNPGIDTIQASVEPEESPWLFYLTDERGTVHYAKDNAEHERNKAKYL